jgi:hypothetical protein
MAYEIDLLEEAKKNNVFDVNQLNIVEELNNCGAMLDTSRYIFYSIDEEIIEKMKEIMHFYGAPTTSLTPKLRKARIALEDYNLDLFCKRVGDEVFFVNTNTLCVNKDLIKVLLDNGVKVKKKPINGIRFVANL